MSSWEVTVVESSHGMVSFIAFLTGQLQNKDEALLPKKENKLVSILIPMTLIG